MLVGNSNSVIEDGKGYSQLVTKGVKIYFSGTGGFSIPMAYFVPFK